jgi:hypothetical protein
VREERDRDRDRDRKNLKFKIKKNRPDVVVHTCNPNTQKAEAGGWRV